MLHVSCKLKGAHAEAEAAVVTIVAAVAAGAIALGGAAAAAAKVVAGLITGPGAQGGEGVVEKEAGSKLEWEEFPLC